MNGRVRIDQPAVIGLCGVIAFIRRQELQKGFPGFREDAPHIVNEPVQLPLTTCEDTPKNETLAAIRMRLTIGQGERRPPGAAKQQGAFQIQMSAQLFDISNQMLGGVCVGAAMRT